MRSFHLTYGGGLVSLCLRGHEVAKPGPGEVLVRDRATSLNARELMILRGDYPLPVKPDVIAVSDGASGECALDVTWRLTFWLDALTACGIGK
jgi:NADPH:quinone reductase-like Zn-dependent oxidoreductase